MGLLQIKTNSDMVAEEQKAAREALEIQKIQSQTDEFKTELSAYIRDAFFAAKKAKESVTRQMIKNLRQSNGEYEPDKLADIRAMGGSEVFMNITSTKNRSAIAWIKDILFQPGQAPWDIEATPVPKLTPESEAMAIQIFNQEAQAFLINLARSSQVTDPAMLPAMLQQLVPEFKKRFKKLEIEVAREKAGQMKLKIEDQFVEGHYYDALNDMIYNIVVLKAGFLKGPILRKKKVRKLFVNEKTRSASTGVAEEIIPEYDSRSPFDIFPGPGATNVNDAYLIDRLTMTRTEIQSLIGLPGFDEVAIRDVLKEYGEGGLREWTWDEQERLEAEGRDTSTYQEWDKIDCLEFWGAVPGRLLREWGMKEEEIPDADLDYNVCAWLIGNHVLKVMLNPDPLGNKPYYKASFVEEPGNFWGLGLPETIADAQTVCNAVARAIVNNVALGSGPQIELNVDRLAPGESDKIWPWRVWKVNKDMMASGNAMQFYQPANISAELIAVYNAFSKIADEHCGVPAYAHGDSQVGGAGNTASGLSMLMTQAARGIKAVIRTIDDKVIKPSAESQYYFNYDVEEALEYIGDVKIVAKGSSSLLAKEQQALRLNEFAKSTANPIDFQITGIEGRRYILKETAKSLDLEVDKAVPDQAFATPIPAPQGAPPPGAQTLDVAGNPAQGAGTELFKPAA
jgi:hypothetical protein